MVTWDASTCQCATQQVSVRINVEVDSFIVQYSTEISVSVMQRNDEFVTPVSVHHEYVRNSQILLHGSSTYCIPNTELKRMYIIYRLLLVGWLGQPS